MGFTQRALRSRGRGASQRSCFYRPAKVFEFHANGFHAEGAEEQRKKSFSAFLY